MSRNSSRRLCLLQPCTSCWLGSPSSYRARELYAVVSDVASYPQFIPFCLDSKIDVSAHRKAMQQKTVVDAELTVGFLDMKESYVSVVTAIPFKSVEVWWKRLFSLRRFWNSRIGHRIFFDPSLQNIIYHLAISEPFEAPDIQVWRWHRPLWSSWPDFSVIQSSLRVREPNSCWHFFRIFWTSL